MKHWKDGDPAGISSYTMKAGIYDVMPDMDCFLQLACISAEDSACTEVGMIGDHAPWRWPESPTKNESLD